LGLRLRWSRRTGPRSVEDAPARCWPTIGFSDQNGRGFVPLRSIHPAADSEKARQRHAAATGRRPGLGVILKISYRAVRVVACCSLRPLGGLEQLRLALAQRHWYSPSVCLVQPQEVHPTAPAPIGSAPCTRLISSASWRKAHARQPERDVVPAEAAASTTSGPKPTSHHPKICASGCRGATSGGNALLERGQS